MRQFSVSAVILALHGVRRDAESVGFSQDIAVAQYTIGTTRLAQLLDEMNPKASCTVREFVGKSAGDFRILTFDDGLISDFVTVFPLLLSRQVGGTFFVTANHVGRDGFTSLPQLKEMTSAYMEIGSHGLTHRYLVTMSRRDALREIQESKARLEQMLGTEVVSFAPVGGHFRKWMVDAAAEAGYRAFATMIPGRTTKPAGLSLLRRNHIQSHHNARYVSRLLSGHRGTLLTNRVRYFLLKQPKHWLGLRNYDRLRDLLLRALRSHRSNSTTAER
jgi:peptidoglycan/xylan/chitin deacetylase (PgdA/CDA1 family)